MDQNFEKIWEEIPNKPRAIKRIKSIQKFKKYHIFMLKFPL